MCVDGIIIAQTENIASFFERGRGREAAGNMMLNGECGVLSPETAGVPQACGGPVSGTGPGRSGQSRRSCGKFVVVRDFLEDCVLRGAVERVRR